MSEFALIARECVNGDIRANPSISGEGNLAPGPQPPLAAAAAWLSAKCLGRSTDKWLPSDWLTGPALPASLPVDTQRIFCL